jgi:hypothetical protein
MVVVVAAVAEECAAVAAVFLVEECAAVAEVEASRAALP